MRVSKTVREYIENKVTEKLTERYAAEKAQAEREAKIWEEVLEAAATAAQEVFIKTITEQVKPHPFLELSPQNFPNCYCSRAAIIPDRHKASSVHRWQDHIIHDRNEIVRNIIVELELGGTKADLERILAEI